MLAAERCRSIDHSSALWNSASTLSRFDCVRERPISGYIPNQILDSGEIGHDREKDTSEAWWQADGQTHQLEEENRETFSDEEVVSEVVQF